jgi:site-specific DNA-methyltransferase (adenine-specific)
MNKAYCADCIAFMQTMDAESVDLTVTSPPYDGIRDYNGYTFDWKATIRELYRVTKRGGSRLDRQRSDRGRFRNGNFLQASPVRRGVRLQSA